MPYVRRRGNHIAIVHGTRNRDTKKVDQEVLMTLHSKAEALAALGRPDEARGWSFRRQVEDRYPDLRFPWPKINKAIDALKDELPDITKSREERAMGGFGDAIGTLTRNILEADPQTLDSARGLIEGHRAQLEWLTELIEWRLKASELTEPSEWSKDPFGWRLALNGGTMDPELEEGVARRIGEGRLDEAESLFSLLVRIYPKYAEGWNYLGNIAFARKDFEEALGHYETCETIGRKLFPKRIAKGDYWLRLETRPYMRGLRNQWEALNRLGRHAAALLIAERLMHECGDDVTAAYFRATSYLNTGEWGLAHEAAHYTAGIFPEQSLLIAFAAFELGDLVEARARFTHATLNRPRTVAITLGQRSSKPKSYLETEDHNGGVHFRDDLADFVGCRSKGSKRFFVGLWKDEELTALREELAALEAQKDGLGRDEVEEQRRLFDRIAEMKSWEYARRDQRPSS